MHGVLYLSLVVNLIVTILHAQVLNLTILLLLCLQCLNTKDFFKSVTMNTMQY